MTKRQAMRIIMLAGMTAAAVGVADLAEAQGVATGCLKKNGQLTELRPGLTPLRGTCSGNGEIVQLQLAPTVFNIAMAPDNHVATLHANNDFALEIFCAFDAHIDLVVDSEPRRDVTSFEEHTTSVGPPSVETSTERFLITLSNGRRRLTGSAGVSFSHFHGEFMGTTTYVTLDVVLGDASEGEGGGDCTFRGVIREVRLPEEVVR